MKRKLFNQPTFYYILFAVLLIPALFINLGAHHIFVHTDESRRALVALEMIINSQYLAPTLNGQFYYEKPPLFNWILVLSFKAFGEYSAYAMRFPVAIFVILYGIAMDYFLRPILGKKKAWLVIIATITSGRILFYDSFLGLIDIGFSILVFINFMLFFKLGKERRYLALFLITYGIAAVAYLMKGLPSLVFQFFTIIAWAVYIRDWKFIFHKYNFLGTLCFIIPVGLYYYFYQWVNPDSLLTVFEYTWHQSSQRTVTEHSIWDTVLSILTFPFENLYHFAPWTILVAALFSKKTLQWLWSNDFSRYAILVFAFNIAVYWTSAGVHPRYLFMFLPLLFVVLIEAYFQLTPRFKKTIDMVFFGLMALAVLAPVAINIASEFRDVPGAGFKTGFLVFGLLSLVVVYYRRPPHRLVILGIFLLVLRIGFNWFILPYKDSRGQAYANAAERIVEIIDEDPIYALTPSYCHDATSFTISRGIGEILELRHEMEPGAFYILHEGLYDPTLQRSYIEFGTRGTDKRLHLVKLIER